MLILEIFLGLVTVLNIAWASWNRRGLVEHQRLVAMMTAANDHAKANVQKCLDMMSTADEHATARAQGLLDKAKQIAADARIEQQHRFCRTCGRIVTRHTTVEGETYCINCAADLAKGYSMGARIDG
jgi:NADH pyrophosphatase NudC (nudix superfamily)